MKEKHYRLDVNYDIKTTSDTWKPNTSKTLYHAGRPNKCTSIQEHLQTVERVKMREPTLIRTQKAMKEKSVYPNRNGF